MSDSVSEPQQSAPVDSGAPTAPLVVRVADEIGASVAERVAYYGLAAVCVVVAPDGTFQIRSTTIEINRLVGVLARLSHYLMTEVPQALSPGQLAR